jgi:hypothetical protein
VGVAVGVAVGGRGVDVAVGVAVGGRGVAVGDGGGSVAVIGGAGSG